MAFAQYQFRRDTAANWTSANPVLLAGELGYETDTQQFKVGNGTTAWNSLPYGGIKGDTGATGAAGVSPTVTVGATTVVTPATNPSVTDADAGPNADLRFSLPRARNVTAGTTTTGAAGTSASVTSQADANGDVSLNFTIPRGDTGATGATGPTGPAANSFTNIAVTGQNTVVADQANDTLTLVAGTNITLTTNDVADSVTIAATIAAQNQFAAVSVGTSPTPTLIQADTAADTLTINAGTGISLTADAATDTFSIVNADTGSAARTAHEEAADPHPQYLTTAEGDARYQAAGSSNIKIFTSTVNLTANTAATVTHNLALTNKDTFVIRTATSDGVSAVVTVTSVNTNSLTLRSAVSVTGLIVTILGF